MSDVIEARIGYPKKGKTIEEWFIDLGSTLQFEEIDYANFTDAMMLAIVELDKDHCAYVLVPKDYIEWLNDIKYEME